MDLLGLVVEDRLLHRALEELRRVAAEELVERVLAGDVHGEPGVAAPGASPHLPQRGHRAGEGHAQSRVEVADVDAELERVGGHDGEQVALGEPLLDLAPLHGRVAGAVGGDPLGEVHAAGRLQPLAREALDQLDPTARLQEADRPYLTLDEGGEEVRGLAQGGGSPPQLLVDQRGIPHGDLALRARGSVAVDQLDLHAGEALGELRRVGDRGAREQEARLAAVGAGEPPQAPQHVRHMRAEHAPVHVRLVDHDPGEVGEHVAPRAVVRQHPHVEHVRVREDQVRALADSAPLLARRVAVVDGLAQVAAADPREPARLVLGERLGRDRGRRRAPPRRSQACRAPAG